MDKLIDRFFGQVSFAAKLKGISEASMISERSPLHSVPTEIPRSDFFGHSCPYNPNMHGDDFLSGLEDSHENRSQNEDQDRPDPDEEKVRFSDLALPVQIHDRLLENGFI